jgi:anaerobic dimethyl sulfoxide reductase subunit B (iron-sulfur subunit)
MRALDFGPMDELMAKYGNLRQLDDMPGGNITKPAAVFKPHDGKREIVPWDADRALELWKSRGPFAPEGLPDVFQKKTDLTEVPENFVGRDRLVLKAKGVGELMCYTTDDE